MEKELLYGRRSVLELLESGLEINEILFVPGGHGRVIAEILSSAESRNIRICSIDRSGLDKMAPGANHQGVLAYYHKPKLLNIEDLIECIPEESPRPVMILDGIEDPHNLGAIIRTVEVLGGGGIVIRKRRSADLTPSAVKASSGAALWLPIAVASNLDRAIEFLKEKGYWIYGLDADAETNIWDFDLSGKIGLVVGAEGKGISHLLKSRCDQLLSIPQVGKVASLNVSVSAALTLGEWLRQSMRKMVQGLDLSKQR